MSKRGAQVARNLALFEAEWEAAHPELFDGIADRCVGPVTARTIPDPRRSGWLLAANRYAVLADASPWEGGLLEDGTRADPGPLNLLSVGLRWTQRDPVRDVECLDGELRGLDSTGVPDRQGTWPVWPLGLAMQGVLVAGLGWWGHRRLDTPAGRLPAGTRVA